MPKKARAQLAWPKALAGAVHWNMRDSEDGQEVK